MSTCACRKPETLLTFCFRTHGEDEIQDGLENLNVNTAPNPTNPTIVEPEQQSKSAVGGILRRFSTRKQKEPYDAYRERKDKPTSHPPPALAAYQKEKPDLLSPPATGDAAEERRPKRSHGLGKSKSCNIEYEVWTDHFLQLSRSINQRQLQRHEKETVPPWSF